MTGVAAVVGHNWPVFWASGEAGGRHHHRHTLHAGLAADAYSDGARHR